MKSPTSPRFTIPLALFLFASAMNAAEIAPTNPLLRYVGRFEHAEAAGPRCSWPASTVRFTVSGGSVKVKLRDEGENFWQVVVDGRPTEVIKLEPGDGSYLAASQLPPGNHMIELVKRTEAFLGVTQILGFEIDDDAGLLPTPERRRRIEVIGDSISCGYGNESANKEEKFRSETENAWLAYGAVASRLVAADYHCIAWSGKKLWPDNSIVGLYERTLPDAANAKWDFSLWIPDAVVINLGTNDFNLKTNPEEAGWVAAYVRFIREIRHRYPQTPIYCAVGTMLNDWPQELKPRTTILAYFGKILAEVKEPGASPVHLLDFGMQDPDDGIGAGWHPSVKTHARMAEKLATVFKQDLGW